MFVFVCVCVAIDCNFTLSIERNEDESAEIVQRVTTGTKSVTMIKREGRSWPLKGTVDQPVDVVI